MSEILLLRHGQASFGADNYDQLSDLGHRQAVYLGEYMAQMGRAVDRIVMGSMVRHRQTAEALAQAVNANLKLEVHAGLNEYNFQGLLDALRNGYPQQWSASGHARRDYYQNIKRALGYWMDGAIASDGEDTWASFCSRIAEALDFASSGSARRVLVVTSGGPIGLMLARVLGMVLGMELGMGSGQICNLILQIKNCSVSTLLHNKIDYTLDSFNDVSHLATPEKRQLISFS